MFVLGNFLYSTAYVLRYVLQLLNILILIRAVLSWVNADPYNPLVRTIVAVTEPILKPFRNIVSPYKIGVDLSPVFAFLFLLFLEHFAVKTLFDLSYKLR